MEKPLIVNGQRSNTPDEVLHLYTEQPNGTTVSRALREGWMLKVSSHDNWLYKVLHSAELARGGRRVYVRLCADSLAFYEDRPGAPSGRGKKPTEVIFLSGISALLGHAKGSDHLRIIQAKGAWWELRHEYSLEEVEEWVRAISSRLAHFRQAARQSQKFTQSAIVSLDDPSTKKRMKRRRQRRQLARWLPCCGPCIGARTSGNHFALTRRLSGHREPIPFKGPREGHGKLVDPDRLKMVSDPELQEAQGAHWSEQAVRYLQCCQRIPEELSHDFTLTLRMGAPDGLKRLIWPLAAGEAVVPPKIVGRGGASSATQRDASTFYEGVCQRAFGGVRPDKFQDPVPTFCQGIQGLEEAPPLCNVVKHLGLITTEGEDALRRLLWCVQLTCSVEFCPFLPNLLATLIVFFDEAETMMIVTDILREAEREPHPDKAINPRIILSRVQINKQAKLFVREGKKRQNAPETFAHLEELGVDVHAMAVALLQDGMAHCLPFRALCRVVGSFLREGSEVVLRYGLALIKMRSPQLLACKTKEEALKELGSLGVGISTTETMDSFSKVAFSIAIKDTSMARVSSFWGSDYVAPKTQDYRPHIFCRPRLFPPRGYVPDDLWEVLWSWVPTSCRIFDPRLIYTPSTHGTSMRTCLELCKKHQDAPMFFFAYTQEGNIIGGYAPTVWVRTSGYIKLTDLRRAVEDSFVFRRVHGAAAPEVFAWSGANELLMQASEVHGLVFGGDGAAISIGRDLVWCSTRSSASFDSPVLLTSAPAEAEDQQGEDGTLRTTSSASLIKTTSKSSVTSCGFEHSDFEMARFEVFALL